MRVVSLSLAVVCIIAAGVITFHSYASLKKPMLVGAADCQSQLLLSSDGTDVWALSNQSAFYFVTGMTIDADGSPRAYKPDNTGLDDLKNAQGELGWVGIVVENGEPVLQGPDDPAPGYYVSRTALEDHSRRDTDPARFVDSEKIPFIVLPADVARKTGARLGDFAFVQNMRNGLTSPAIFADIGPGLGEGSIALARALRINPDARDGGAYRGVLYVVFPGSGNHRPRPSDEIKDRATQLLSTCGGMDSITRCLP